MTDENFIPSLVTNHGINSGLLSIPQGYYRSKLFIAPVSTNSLVAAAGPLLSLLERLCLSSSLPAIEQIRTNMEHEIYAFLSKLAAAKHPEALMSIAHYVMAATLDELIGKNYLRVYQREVEFKAFTPLTEDGAAPQTRFFEIVDYIKERPNQYLDLIELIYFLLIAGYEGQYHMKADGRQQLDNHIEELYQIIQRDRYNKPHRLFRDNSIPVASSKNYKNVFLALSAAATLIVVAFFTSQVFLENKAKSLMYSHSQLALLDN